jgi:ABC-type polar amino acid transport system ATPase subunit
MMSPEVSSTSVDAGSEILRVQNVGKRFADMQVLQGISFVLHEREILGVIGPSGSGKTTLLKCINLLETIDQGRIEYLGSHSLEVTPTGVASTKNDTVPKSNSSFGQAVNLLRQDIGFVFQGFNLWEERTVLGNLILAPTVVLRQSADEAEMRARKLCHQFGLEAKVGSHVWELSGGQRQRVAIMRALMMQPKIMLLDEITSALDPVLTVEVMQAIKQLRDQGLTMMIVTHHIEFASSVCDRIMFLSDGKIIQLGAPDTLRTSPSNEAVRQFLAILRAAR